ncbi:hypothetical protein H4R19_000826 [Coemansia spiralis]|nr:hypothetical protein H4R19_000826 [Coemansia spiralis]
MIETREGFSADGSASEYVLSNAAGTRVSVTNWGARVTRFVVRDRAGQDRDVVPGFDTHAAWQDSLAIDDPYFGATVGRVAGRIAPCEIEVGGQTCRLPENQPGVCLHGGRCGFDKKLFSAQVIQPATLALTCVSPDGEEGFPGMVELRVEYTLDESNALHIRYTGRLLAGAATVLNPTNHTYWNLTGFEEPTVHDHVCWVAADHVMATRDGQVPTGELLPVAGTVLDFGTRPRRFGDGLAELEPATRGYDHVFALAGGVPGLREVAYVESPRSGLRLTVLTDQPALVVYTGNWISDRLVGKHGVRYGNHAAVALEAQQFPNAIHLPAHREGVIVTPDKPYSQHTVFRIDIV